MTRLRPFAWIVPALAIAAFDLAVRWRQVIQWSPREFAWYGFSVAFALLWLRLSVWMLLQLRRVRWMFWGAVFLLAAALAFILLVHFNHYLYFGVHPEVISFSQFLNEPAETLRVVGNAFTPLNQGVMGVLTLLLMGLWRLGLDPPPRRRRGWALLVVGVALLPVFHNNTQWGRGNFYPPVSFVFNMSKAVQFHLEGRRFRQLPVAQRPVPARIRRPQPYDALVFVSESVRSASVSYLGYGRPTTPREDAYFAAHPDTVFVFPHCFTNSIHTNPSVPSLLSGVHPMHFPERMGRTPLTYEYSAAYPGVDTFFYSAQAFETYRFQDFFESKLLNHFVYQENSGRPAFSFGGMDDRFLLPLLQSTLDGLKPRQPFSGVLHFNGTHHPYRVPEDAQIWGKRTPIDQYDNAIRYQDQVIGEVLGRLEQARRLERTILLFASDHGEGMDEHGISGHRRAYYEEFIHVPCWLILPDAPAKKYGPALRANAKGNVTNVDWVPTLVDLLGLAEQPDVKALLAQLDGVSLLHPADPERLIVVHNGVTNVRVLQGFALIRGNRRLLFHPVGDVGGFEFYDLTTDPGERNNLWPTLTPDARKPWLRDIESHPVLRDEVRRAPPREDGDR